MLLQYVTSLCISRALPSPCPWCKNASPCATDAPICSRAWVQLERQPTGATASPQGWLGVPHGGGFAGQGMPQQQHGRHHRRAPSPPTLSSASPPLSSSAPPPAASEPPVASRCACCRKPWMPHCCPLPLPATRESHFISVHRRPGTICLFSFLTAGVHASLPDWTCKLQARRDHCLPGSSLFLDDILEVRIQQAMPPVQPHWRPQIFSTTRT